MENPAWASLWREQDHPVMMVIRTSDGVIRWMDVTEYLRRERREGDAPSEIVFRGERFDVMSVRRLREKALGIR